MSELGFNMGGSAPQNPGSAPQENSGAEPQSNPGHGTGGGQPPVTSQTPTPPPAPKKKRNAAVVLLGGLAALAAVLLVAGFFATRVLGWGASDYSGSGTGEVTVEVLPGQTLSSIGTTLEDNGVVKSSQAFVNAAKANDAGTKIGPGQYRLRREMSGAAAVDLMLSPESRVVNKLVIPEGLRKKQVFKLAAQASGLPVEDFQKAAKLPELGLPEYANGNAEGFLFPATYELEKGDTALKILQKMVQRFNEAATKLGIADSEQKNGHTPYETMIIASLVQAEGHPDDYAKVARVVENRLQDGMPLQFDSTVNYALGKSDIRLNDAELKTESPYNTYVNTGLPPTPINQPGEAAIAAALQPEEGDWLYFVTVDPDTGETKFTSSYDEFLTFKEEFLKNLNR